MSVFITLKGDKRADKERLAQIHDLLGAAIFEEEALEAEEFGAVLYAALRMNGKLPKAAKPWKRIGIEERLKWGGIASLVYWAIEDRNSRLDGGDFEVEEPEADVADEDFEDLKAAEDKGSAA